MRKLLFILLFGFSFNVLADSQQVIPMVQHDTATFYVKVKIADEISEEFVIDTGASHVTISRHTLNKLLKKDQATFIRSMVGVLADGTSIDVPVYRISRLDIGGTCHFENIEVAVIEGDARCVLGLSVLRQAAPFTFNLDPPQLELSHCSGA